MTKIAAGFAALVLTVSGVALASSPVATPTAPVKAAATHTAPVKEHINKAPTPTHVSGTAETKTAPVVKPEAGKAEAIGVKKTDDKLAPAVTTAAPAAKTTTN